ncbi:LacI family DNA-binding transcriptional regulator [Bacillus lacus]|uniref:LacI family DNA-binding transcriptional regulator n=1 Tax=Metabacillus lacus TaxID=1983721 RepID=A0A7X2LZL3_9BACI|nr:LacI family DNA-binding transcriptional regulator [Metabacillus lacus]MRX73551.1 LacI family DNA-binding transcriptional regulator [Metabacillus lacus]
MATIEDVAKLAGLSRTTVSRVINKHPYVSSAKKDLVLQAMEELGYVPNSSARSLRNQKTGVIAVFIPRVMNPFFSQLIETLEIAASLSHYQLLVCQTQYSAEKELTYLQLLKVKQVDGVILASFENEWSKIEPFLEYGPIVLCNEFEKNARVPMVLLDQAYGGYIAAKHLLENGHTAIAYCCGSYRSNVSKAREAGFRKALAEYGVPFQEELAFRNAFQVEDGKRVFQQLAAKAKKPTAIFTGSDEVAAGLIAEAKRNHWVVPDDLAVIGFDNQIITELIEPRITTVHQPVQDMAKKAMDIMVSQLASKHSVKQEVHKFQLELVIRESTNKVLVNL